jgi:hypothetical protein
MVWSTKLIYSVIASLDDYIKDAGGTFGWAAPDEAAHVFVNGPSRAFPPTQLVPTTPGFAVCRQSST